MESRECACQEETESRECACQEEKESRECACQEEKGGESSPAGESKEKEEKKGPSLEEQLEEMRGNYLRALAELENYRKRMAREMNDLRETTRHRTISELLGIYDLLQMAVESARNAQDMAALRQGVEMTFGEVKRTLGGLGVETLEAAGQAFDPACHQAVGAEPSEEVPEGVVLRQWKPGFRIGGKLLRPAVVVVSKGGSQPPREEAAQAPEAPGEAEEGK